MACRRTCTVPWQPDANTFLFPFVKFAFVNFPFMNASQAAITGHRLRSCACQCRTNRPCHWPGDLSRVPYRFVGPRVKSHMGVPEKGWVVVTPVFSSDRQRAILVRRGWVPDSWRKAAEAAAPAPERSNLSGVGVVSGGERGSSVTFANDPGSDFWQLLDPVAMVRALTPLPTCHQPLQLQRLRPCAPPLQRRPWMLQHLLLTGAHTRLPY